MPTFIFKSYEQRMADYWEVKLIKATADIANYGGAETSPAKAIERENNALAKLAIWEDRLNRYAAKFDLGAEMAKYEPKGPQC